MRARSWFFVIFAVLAGGAVVGLVRQHDRAGQLRQEIARRQVEFRERTWLETENRRLAATQPTEQQMDDLATKLVLAEQLRSQLALMRRREESALAARRAAEAGSGIPSLVGNAVAADQWRNAGRATPAAALQTTLWAAAHGDIEALADILAFDADTRRQATDTFDRLPAVLQNELGTPERMIALLTASDVPLGRASILAQYPGAADTTRLSVQLTDAGGQATTTMFSLQADADQWRLKVPPSVVKKYATWLGLPP